MVKDPYPWKIDCTDKEHVPQSTTQLQAVTLDGEPALYINLDHPRWAFIQALVSELVDEQNECE